MNQEHKHGILVIKNKNNEYLQYYDNRWNGYLFLNCKLKDEFDIVPVKKEIFKVLNKDKELHINFVYDIIHTKFSESAKIEKIYHHYFFTITTKSLPSYMVNKEFIINDTKYRWFSMKELESDKRIQKINSDIVEYIKNNNL